MDTQLVRHWQTTAALAQGLLSLPGSRGSAVRAPLSPYFQMTDPRKEAPGRNTHIFLNNMKAVVLSFTYVSGPTMAVVTGFHSGASYTEEAIIPLTGFNFDSGDFVGEVNSVILAYATGQSYTLSSSDIRWPDAVTSIMNAPQAAIADAPADAVTNYNTITTLLGAVTGAVNDANTKQNAIATKLNTLLAELRTLGLISV